MAGRAGYDGHMCRAFHQHTISRAVRGKGAEVAEYMSVEADAISACELADATLEALERSEG